MATTGKVVRIDFRAKERTKDPTILHPLEKLATLIATHISTREQVAETLDPIAAGIRTADLPQRLTGTRNSTREQIALSICRAGARHPSRSLNVQLTSHKAEEVLASNAGRALRDVRQNYRDMLTIACLTPNAIPDAATIKATIQALKTQWQGARAGLLASSEFDILSRYLAPEHLRRLIPEDLIEGDPTTVVNDLCHTYTLYEHIYNHLPHTETHRNELLLIQNELNRLTRYIPTVVFDGLPPKQIKALQTRLLIIKGTLEQIAREITPDTIPGNFANAARAKKVNQTVQLVTQKTNNEDQSLIELARDLIDFIETNYLHSTAIYSKLKKWPPELEAALIAYMIDKYQLTGPVRIRLERALAKKTGTP